MASLLDTPPYQPSDIGKHHLSIWISDYHRSYEGTYGRHESNRPDKLIFLSANIKSDSVESPHFVRNFHDHSFCTRESAQNNTPCRLCSDLCPGDSLWAPYTQPYSFSKLCHNQAFPDDYCYPGQFFSMV